MKRQMSGMVVLALLLSAGGVCRAWAGPDLEKAVTEATTIVVGRLDQYIAEPESLDRLVEHNFRANPGWVVNGNADSIYLGTVQYRGTYGFHVETAVKGKPGETLVVRLPRYSGVVRGDGFFQPGRPEIPLKANYLLMLSGDAEHGYVPTTVAPIPVSAKTALLKESLDGRKSEEQVAAVRGYFIASLEDAAGPGGRATAAYMLSGSKDNRVLEAMRPYADDKDASVRDSVLECMALNQDLSAIGKIAATGEGTEALRQFKTPEAIPLLNKVILEGATVNVRNAAVLALGEQAPSRSSIPYLIRALRDKDMLVVRNSYWQLQKTVPELKLGAVRDQPAEVEIQRAEKWWAETRPNGIL